VFGLQAVQFAGDRHRQNCGSSEWPDGGRRENPRLANQKKALAKQLSGRFQPARQLLPREGAFVSEML